MSDEFTRTAQPLDEAGLQAALDSLGVSAAQLWAVLQVETSGHGFQSDRRPVILFERHVFRRLTQGAFDGDHPDISNPQAGGYGPAGGHQYDRLEAAMKLDRRAALESASWGIGQVMGFNAGSVGYDGVQSMVDDLCESEAAQILAMARFIETSKLAGSLRSNDWGRFASGYNGLGYRMNNYDTRLAASYQALDRGALPDLDIRTGQLELSYRGFDPNGVDGVMGKFTRSAMNAFQQANGLPLTEAFDSKTLAALRIRH